MILGTLLRPDGLLVGCALALALHRFDIRRILGRWIGVAGVAGLAVSVATLIWARSPMWVLGLNPLPLWGLSLFNLGVTVTLGWLVLAPSTPLARLLSLRPLCWVGRRAYGLYVLHPLVFRVLDASWHAHGPVADLARVVASLVVAGLSYRFVETPFLRLKERFAVHATPRTDGSGPLPHGDT